MKKNLKIKKNKVLNFVHEPIKLPIAVIIVTTNIGVPEWYLDSICIK